MGCSERASRPPKPESRGGFTVIEVAVALSILSIGLLALGAMIPATKVDLDRSTRRERATFAAQQSAEWLHGLPYADTLLVAGPHPWEAFGATGLERQWLVEDDVPSAGVKRVTVVVRRSATQEEAGRVIFLHAEAGR